MEKPRMLRLFLVLVAMPCCAHPALSFIACPLVGRQVRSSPSCGPAKFALRLVTRPHSEVPRAAARLRQVAISCSMSQDRAGPSADEFYDKAERLLTEAGGQLDSLAFGRKWKKAHPDDNIERYKGPGVSTIAQMLSISPRFRVTGRSGSSTKTFALATQDSSMNEDTAASQRAVEERRSRRGYSFSVISANKRGSDTKWRSSSPEPNEDSTYAEAETSRSGAEGQMESAAGTSRRRDAGPVGGKGGGAAKLIDVWSQAAALSEADDEGRQEQQAMAMMRVAGARPDALPYTRVINEHARAAAKGDRSALSRAFQVLEDMQGDGVEPNKITYTALITACAKAAGAGLGSVAVDRGVLVLEKMVQSGMEIDTVTYNALLDACAKAAAVPSPDAMSALEMGFSLVSRMEREGPRPDYVTYNTLMHACAKAAAFPSHGAECVERALQLLDRMEEANVAPQVMTYNALVDACARAGKGVEGIDLALSILRRMETSGLQPDAVTYNSLINTCARAAGAGSRSFQAGLMVLDRMQVAGVRPNVVTFNSLATIIARTAQAGDIIDPGAASSQGQQVLGLLLSADVEPTVVTLNALLSAVVSAGVAGNERSDEEVEGLLEILLQLGVQPNMVTFNQVLESIQHAQALEAASSSSPSSSSSSSSSPDDELAIGPVDLVVDAQSASGNGTQVGTGEGRGGPDAGWVRGDPDVDDIMEALDILEDAGGINSAILRHVEDLVLRSKERVLLLLPLVRRLIAEGARPQLPMFHALLGRCMSFGSDGLGEAIALCDIMYQVGVEFTAQTEAIADRIRQAHEDDPALAGMEAWDVITPEIQGLQTEEEDAGEADMIEVREMTPETMRALLRQASAGASLDTLPGLSDDEWEQDEWLSEDAEIPQSRRRLGSGS